MIKLYLVKLGSIIALVRDAEIHDDEALLQRLRHETKGLDVVFGREVVDVRVSFI